MSVLIHKQECLSIMIYFKYHETFASWVSAHQKREMSLGAKINIIIIHANWMNEWGMLRARLHFLLADAKQKVRACTKFPHSLSPWTNFALHGQSVSQSVRERDTYKERERGRGGGEKERDRERWKQETERERYAEYGCFILIFNRNDRCLGTF